VLPRPVVPALLVLGLLLSACGSGSGDPGVDEGSDAASRAPSGTSAPSAVATAATTDQVVAEAQLEDFCVALNRVYYPEEKTGDDLQADVAALEAVGTPAGLDQRLRDGLAYFIDTVAAEGRTVTPDFVDNVGDSSTDPLSEGWHDQLDWFEENCDAWQDPEAALAGSGTVTGGGEAPAGRPEDVVRAYYDAEAARDCPGIVATLSSRQREQGVLCEGDPAAAFDSPAPTIEVERIRVTGDRAEVDVVEDPGSDDLEVTVVLVGEDGAWLINDFLSDY
jgi:hypothetical protein